MSYNSYKWFFKSTITHVVKTETIFYSYSHSDCTSWIVYGEHVPWQQQQQQRRQQQLQLDIFRTADSRQQQLRANGLRLRSLADGRLLDDGGPAIAGHLSHPPHRVSDVRSSFNCELSTTLMKFTKKI